MFAGVTVLIMIVFILYQVYLVGTGISQNESYKWEELNYIMKENQTIREKKKKDPDDKTEETLLWSNIHALRSIETELQGEIDAYPSLVNSGRQIMSKFHMGVIREEKSWNEEYDAIETPSEDRVIVNRTNLLIPITSAHEVKHMWSKSFLQNVKHILWPAAKGT